MSKDLTSVSIPGIAPFIPGTIHRAGTDLISPANRLSESLRGEQLVSKRDQHLDAHHPHYLGNSYPLPCTSYFKPPRLDPGFKHRGRQQSSSPDTHLTGLGIKYPSQYGRSTRDLHLEIGCSWGTNLEMPSYQVKEPHHVLSKKDEGCTITLFP